MTRLAPFFTAACALALGACSTGPSAASGHSPAKTVPFVDLDRYTGKWYVISHTPNFLEKGKVGTSDTYRSRPDGKMDNIFTFRKGSLDAPERTWRGTAWVTNTQTNAEWKVRLFWPVTSGYRILELDPDYQWAVVASSGDKLLWVLARATSLPDSTYQSILERIKRQGLDANGLERVPQQGSTGN